jgi:hypothetical protein
MSVQASSGTRTGPCAIASYGDDEPDRVEPATDPPPTHFSPLEAKGRRPMSTPTIAPTVRRALILRGPVKNTLGGSTVVQAKRSPQRHVLPASTTTTLCGIDTGTWVERADVDVDAKVTCPLCAKAFNDQAKTV